MPSETYYSREFESYIPILDPRRLSKPALIYGKNFLFDVDGPRSAFNCEFYNWFKYGATDRRSWRDFKVENEIWYGTPTGIWRIMPVSLEPELLLDIQAAPLQKYWPWTCAKVGGLYYFGQHDKGLWQFDPSTKAFTKIDTPVGRKIRGVTASYGRLVCLSDTTVFWSALDDGTDLIPSTETGAGAQALSMLSANAFRVDGVADGIIVSTDKGYLKGEFVLAGYVFRWYILSDLMKPFTPNATVKLPDVGLLTLDTRGFYLSNGKIPEPWEQLHGEFFSKNFIAKMDRRRLGCLALHYSYAAKALYVSFAPNEREGTFTFAFVYLMTSGKWGVFNRDHHGFFELTRQPEGIETSAYMQSDGRVRMFTTKLDVEVLPAAPESYLDFLIRKFEEPQPRMEDGVITGVTDLWFVDKNPSVLSVAVPKTGMYVSRISDTETASIGGFESTPPSPADPAWYIE